MTKKTIFICRSAAVRDNWIQSNHRSGLRNASVFLPLDSGGGGVGVGWLSVLYTFPSPKSLFKLGLGFSDDVFHKVGREISMDNIELFFRSFEKVQFLG